MIYFTSDNHFGHANIIKYCNRPFVSVEEMDQKMVDLWNATVNQEDTVYCLGDFSLSFSPIETITQKLNGKKILIPGNHDLCHSFHQKSSTLEGKAIWVQKYIDSGWIVLPEQNTLEIEGLGIINMCHHPYKFVQGDHHDDKYEKWRPKDDGKWLICGHVHDKWKNVDNMINVGVDQWGYKPTAVDSIKEIINSKT